MVQSTITRSGRWRQEENTIKARPDRTQGTLDEQGPAARESSSVRPTGFVETRSGSRLSGGHQRPHLGKGRP